MAVHEATGRLGLRCQYMSDEMSSAERAIIVRELLLYF